MPRLGEPSQSKGALREPSLDRSDMGSGRDESRESSNSTNTKPLPFIRPADVYKRMVEENENQRRLQESSRPSSAKGEEEKHVQNLKYKVRLEDDEAIDSICKKVEREKALISAANQMKRSTNSPFVQQRLDSQIQDGRKNIAYLEEKMNQLQARKMGSSDPSLSTYGILPPRSLQGAAPKLQPEGIGRQDVASTRNVLRVASDAEVAGRETLGRLGEQDETFKVMRTSLTRPPTGK
jgi:hypothetical protein